MGAGERSGSRRAKVGAAKAEDQGRLYSRGGRGRRGLRGGNMSNVIEYVGENPVSVLVDGKKFEEFFKNIRKEVLAAPVDLETVKGRKAIASTAYRIAQTKTAIDNAGKALTDDVRKKIKEIDGTRKEIRGRLDALKAEVRKPLDDWEAAEEKRAEIVKEKIAWIEGAGRTDFNDTAETMGSRLADLKAFHVDPDVFQEFEAAAAAKLKDAIGSLEVAVERARIAEAEKAELERLRAEEERRIAEERARRAEEERKRREEAEARRAEEERQRIEALTAARAREEAEQAAEERIRAAEAEKQRVIEAQQAEERRQAEEKRQREEEERRRAADIENRTRVIDEAVTAICAAIKVLPKKHAKAVVEAIADGVVPNVSIRF
ncbi:hypothetical protein [Rhodobium gokarnense]|uniref:DNA repair exonuclease SbcCD ATPase subunit n=1 Tax=Rhodobium gokarnense TaxID=364296 RepID=A0ABT3HH20_9HYPH|nr:hypothetical protein [Rhodobium gokarnense]MCW2309688.1 DNA repair exonuclease SbcCD ATPase subunit [Rhodobium gokarnense]